MPRKLRSFHCVRNIYVGPCSANRRTTKSGTIVLRCETEIPHFLDTRATPNQMGLPAAAHLLRCGCASLRGEPVVTMTANNALQRTVEQRGPRLAAARASW